MGLYQNDTTSFIIHAQIRPSAHVSTLFHPSAHKSTHKSTLLPTNPPYSTLGGGLAQTHTLARHHALRFASLACERKVLGVATHKPTHKSTLLPTNQPNSTLLPTSPRTNPPCCPQINPIPPSEVASHKPTHWRGTTHSASLRWPVRQHESYLTTIIRHESTLRATDF